MGAGFGTQGIDMRFQPCSNVVLHWAEVTFIITAVVSISMTLPKIDGFTNIGGNMKQAATSATNIDAVEYFILLSFSVFSFYHYLPDDIP